MVKAQIGPDWIQQKTRAVCLNSDQPEEPQVSAVTMLDLTDLNISNMCDPNLLIPIFKYFLISVFLRVGSV